MGNKIMKFMEKSFQWNQKFFWIIVFFSTCLRLFWASGFVMTNDEVYYWDWSRHLQMSYLDAPPFVAWVAYVGNLFFQGSLGARFFVPFIHALSILFLVGSLRTLFFNKDDIKIKHILTLLLFAECIPAFNIEGFILLPDASLLLGISGALYFCLKAYSVTFQKPADCSLLTLKYAVGFGFFLGIAALSKYHALPLALGFFISLVYLRGKKNFKGDFAFWLIVILVALCISSPVFIWNYNNEFASFVFQQQHGFSGFNLKIKPLVNYTIGMVFFLFPWYFYLFIKQVIFSSKKSIDVIFISPFLILFFLILFSALGKQALPHWAMPGFFILIPLVVKNYFELSKNRRVFWKRINLFSIIVSILLPSLASSSYVSNLIIKGCIYFYGDASPLAQVYLWPNLQKSLETQYHFKTTFPSYEKKIDCRKETYYLASLRWYWTAQMAFYFENQPRVFNFDFNNPSYYQWRDPINSMKGCKFIVIGSEDQFNIDKISQFMVIKDLQKIRLSSFKETKIVMLKVTVK